MFFVFLLRQGRYGGATLVEGVVEKRKCTVVELVETTVHFLFGTRGRLSPPISHACITTINRQNYACNVA